MIKVQLINQKLGTVNSHIDPQNLKDLQEQVKRSTDNEGVVYNFSTTLRFEKIGREFLRQAYQLDGGIEALVIVNIYEYNSNAYRWQLSMSGKVNFTSYDIDEISVTVNLDQFNFNVSFLNQIDQDISMSTNQTQNGTPLEPLQLVTLKLQPKKILKQYDAFPAAGSSYLFLASNYFTTRIDRSLWGVADTSNLKVSELDDSFGYSSFISANKTDVTDLFNYEAKEAGVIDEIKVNAKQGFTLTIDPYDSDHQAIYDITYRIRHFLLHRDSSGATIDETIINEDNFTINGSDHLLPPWPGSPAIVHIHNINFLYTVNNVNVAIGDTVLVYFECIRTAQRAFLPPPPGHIGSSNYGFYGNNDTLNLSAINLEVLSDNELYIKQGTIFPESTCNAILAYELCERLSQYYTNQIKCFKSTALGRTDTAIPYDADGIASLVAFTNGQLIRKRTDKQLFFNFKEVIQFLAASFGLGWGFETQADGTQMVVVEKFEYFFNRGLKIFELGKVGGLPKEKVKTDLYYQKIKAGFRDLKQIKQINAVDEFNTPREFTTGLTQITNELDLTAGNLSASGFEIESQRRQSGLTQDSPLDDDRFGICVLRDGGVVMGTQHWKNEKAEAFSNISGLYDSPSSYNLRIRPGKNLRRWGVRLSTNFVYSLNKFVKFSSGKGNYNLVCQSDDDAAPFAESDNINLAGVQPLFIPETLELQWALSKDGFDALKKYSYGYIEYLDAKNKIQAGFILDVSSNRTSKVTNFQLLRAL